ncbi:unnamed protein product [Rotaria magnacalcarata]|uniref:Integrase catalytic domain-containing protein n=1 Tax=Rotaria magnacalcarata TaxID=392030 RepID=A0A820GQ66_9BILA|nr:unnamed protein product [Rotaria magnacalcarata]CAF4281454.1 unnamed protein product [Rotaria magnacalcarata]
MENTAGIRKFENNKKNLANMDNNTLEILVINSPKLIFNKWNKQEISIMQRANAQLILLKSFIINYPPNDTRVIKCKHTPNLELFLPNINAIKIFENILVHELDIGLVIDTHRYLAIIPLDKYIQGAIDIHLSRSHCGQHVLQNLLRETVWNPHDWRVIKDVCHTCQMCQRFKAPCNVAHPGYKKIVSTCPFDLLSIDLVNLPLTQDQFGCCLVAVDHYTKYMYTVPLKNKTSENVVQALEKVVFQRCLQLPSRILSDNGPEFDNTLYRHMLVKYNIQPIYASPNPPESNGGVERANQTLIKLLALYQGDQSNWVNILPEVVRTYNSNPHATTKRAPVSFFIERANSLRHNYDNLLTAAWREPSHKFAPFMLNQLVGKKIFHSGHLTRGEVFPPAAQLNKTSKHINTFGNGIISNTHANHYNRNNFIGFIPPVNSSLVGGGGLNSASFNSTAPIVNTLVPTLVSATPHNIPVVINAGGGVPKTPRPPLVDINRGNSTPINVNFLPAHLNMSPIIKISENADNASMPKENIIPYVIIENPIATLNKSLNTLPCLEESGPNQLLLVARRHLGLYFRHCFVKRLLHNIS